MLSCKAFWEITQKNNADGCVTLLIREKLQEKAHWLNRAFMETEQIADAEK